MNMKWNGRLLSGVHKQGETDQNNQQVNISGLIPGLVHWIIQRFLICHHPVPTHNERSMRLLKYATIPKKRTKCIRLYQKTATQINYIQFRMSTYKDVENFKIKVPEQPFEDLAFYH